MENFADGGTLSEGRVENVVNMENISNRCAELRLTCKYSPARGTTNTGRWPSLADSGTAPPANDVALSLNEFQIKDRGNDRADPEQS